MALCQEERRRNELGAEFLYCRVDTPAGQQVCRWGTDDESGGNQRSDALHAHLFGWQVVEELARAAGGPMALGDAVMPVRTAYNPCLRTCCSCKPTVLQL